MSDDAKGREERRGRKKKSPFSCRNWQEQMKKYGCLEGLAPFCHIPSRDRLVVTGDHSDHVLARARWATNRVAPSPARRLIYENVLNKLRVTHHYSFSLWCQGRHRVGGSFKRGEGGWGGGGGGGHGWRVCWGWGGMGVGWGFTF